MGSLGFIKGMTILLGIGGIFYFLFAAGGGLVLSFLKVPWYVWTLLLLILIFFLTSGKR